MDKGSNFLDSGGNILDLGGNILDLGGNILDLGGKPLPERPLASSDSPLNSIIFQASFLIAIKLAYGPLWSSILASIGTQK